ncbi:hypothetical protein HZH68_002583 [Vespula germanica]|uniref:Serpin domain-containing protein n=1 Tax=Vespula germanica TaxID=30212 RepID=A0A834NMK5_VESGE|nr:hypothetical protein HZH68_002583 [Vespula germanica]
MSFKAAVVVDKGFFSGKNEDYRKARTMILDSIHEVAKKEIHMGYIVVHALQDTNIDLREDYMVLLSIATCDKTWYLYELARQSGIIHLAITDRSCPRIPISDGISIPLIVPGEELPQMFLDLRTANALSWKNVVILHDDSFEKEKISDIVQAVTSNLPNMMSNIASRSIFSFKRFASESVRKQHIKDVLNSFHIQQLGNCFLVIVTVDTITDVMEVAKSLKMVHPGSQWLYVLTDAGSRNSTNVTYLADLLPEGGNVAVIYNITKSDGTCNIDLLCHVNDFIRYFVSAIKNSSHINNELYENITGTKHDIFRLTKFQINSHILKNINAKFSGKSNLSNKKCGNCLFWKISSAITWGNYFLHGRKAANLIESSTWNPRRGINLSDVIFPHIAYGFRGISLPIVTFHNPPWQIVNVMKNGEVSYGGLVFDVLKYLSKKLNFTYAVFVPKIMNNTKALRGSTRALKVGERPHGTLTSATRKLPEEVLELVRTKKVLLAACAYTVSDFEKSAINFTIPIFVQTYSFLTSRPTQLSRALLFTSPFTKETWACLAAAIIIMGPILYLVHKYSPSSTKLSGLNSSWQCVWYVYGALLQQGGMYLPKSDSARILVGTWWLIVTVLVATYSGSLIAFLTFPKIDDPILTVDDLLAHKDKLTWGFPNGSFLEEYLQSSENEQYRLLLSRSERHNDTEEADIIRRVKDGKHVFIDWRSSLRTEEFMDEPIAMIVPNNSPYLPIINSELYRMYESGLINKWISEKMPTKDKCWVGANSNEIVDKRKVNVADMQGIFFVLFMVLFGIAHSYQEADFDGWYQPVARRPVDIVTDIVNDLGVRILQQYSNLGNVAFSPIGVAFVLAALYEGSAGGGSHQIAEALALPHDRDITRIGFRDIHRRLRTYLNADGFLGGLTLNRENTKLRPEYEDILRFYGFNLSDVDEKESNDTTTVSTGTTEVTNALITESEDSTKPPTTIIDTTLSSDSSTIPESIELPVTSISISSMTETVGTTISEGMVSDRLTQVSNITTTISSASEANTFTTTVTGGNLNTMSQNSTLSMQLPAVTMPFETMQSTVGQTIGATSTIIPNVPDTTTVMMVDSQTTVNTAISNLQNAENTMIPTSTLSVTTIIESVTPSNMQASSTDSTGQIEAMTLSIDTSSVETNITTTTPVSVTASTGSNLEVGPPAEESTVSTDQPTSGPNTMLGIVDLGSTNPINEGGQATTTVPASIENASGNQLRKRSTRNSRGYFSSYPDEGIWMQDLGIWKAYPTVNNEASVRDSTEISFLVNGCDVSSVMASRYVAVLPFAYFPSLQAVAVEFPLDDPRYNILLLMPTDRTDTHRLARDLGRKSLRWLRKQLQPAWVRATIPSFMLRGFVTLTSFLQRLGITDVFEPRVADLSPMTPDLGVYARDIQQSIGVNIRNYMKPDRTHSRNGLFERAGPVPFTVVHPFLYFIIDTETSVTLIAGRVDDPLNSRII